MNSKLAVLIRGLAQSVAACRTVDGFSASLARIAPAVLSLTLAGTADANIAFQTLHACGQAGPTAPLIQASDGNFYGTTGGDGSAANGTVFRMSTNGNVTLLYSFTGGMDGANPFAGLVQAGDGALYGTTLAGGANDVGTVFRITTNGAFSSLYSFLGGTGANPYGGLVQASDGNLYGTTFNGGASANGAIFRITTNGAFSLLHSFAGGAGGRSPAAGMVQAGDGNLYGTTVFGGLGVGTVFRTTTNGTLTTLYSFGGTNDGQQPVAALVLASDGNLYGTAEFAGTGSAGTVFRMGTNGAFNALYSFPAAGGFPLAGLVQAGDGNLYGTTSQGGYGIGSVFRISTSGTVTNLHAFIGSDGASPQGGLVVAGNGNLYGTTPIQGASNSGTAFVITTGGSFALLHSFAGGLDAGVAYGGLVQGGDGNLYGTTFDGGASTYGSVFRISTGGAFARLYSFTGGNDGHGPEAGLARGNDGNLYGTTQSGGAYGGGVVFRVSTNGAFTRLYSFTGGADGDSPRAGLVAASDGRLYGTTYYGGTNSDGAIFRITTGGSFARLYSFTGGSDGSNPSASLLQAGDGNVYGTTSGGGTNGHGTIFRLSTSGTFSLIYTFSGGTDAAGPYAGLMQAGDGNLYGTAYSGGAYGHGAIFRVTTNGSFSLRYSFNGGNDGENPYGNLIQGNDSNLYGTTYGNLSPGGYGTVFRFGTNGSLTTLYSFTAQDDGAAPNAIMQASDGNLYGITRYAGTLLDGTVFRMFLAPPSFSPPFLSGGNCIFSLPTIPGKTYTIQQNTDFANPLWVTYLSFTGDGSPFQFVVSPTYYPALFFRVSRGD
jgi:uncharacterized repeat protein (TIGR03803 family)